MQHPAYGLRRKPLLGREENKSLVKVRLASPDGIMRAREERPAAVEAGRGSQKAAKKR